MSTTTQEARNPALLPARLREAPVGVRALYVLHRLPGDRLCPASLMALIDAAPREIARELEAWIERGLVLDEACPRALAHDAFVDRFFYIHPERLAEAERVFQVYV